MRKSSDVVGLCVVLLLTACQTGTPVEQPDKSNIYERPQAGLSVVAQGPARHVILMINDGASWGTWDAGAYWSEGAAANAIHPFRDLPVRLGMTTFPLNFQGQPTHDEQRVGGYVSSLAWNDDPVATGGTLPIAGYHYLTGPATESSGSGTQMATGVKSYNGAINVDNQGEPLEFITQIARRAGRRTGVVTSVEFAQATPATFGAQNRSRYNYFEIAHQMLTSGDLDLIMGCGHPGYDSSGRLLPNLFYTGVQASDWLAIQSGTLLPKGAEKPWRLMDQKNEFEQLCSTSPPPFNGEPLLGVVPIRTTLQHDRDAIFSGVDPAQPTGVARLQTVPELACLATGAMNYLNAFGEGFFLMIEGGATDWAAHLNDAGRLVEETVTFQQAVVAVMEWIEMNSSWDETLLIVTTDHGNALPLGPESDVMPFLPVRNRGKGVMPEIRFYTSGHTNEPVRLWARGAGSEQLLARVREIDPGFARHTGHAAKGQLIDATDLFYVMRDALAVFAESPDPSP